MELNSKQCRYIPNCQCEIKNGKANDLCLTCNYARSVWEEERAKACIKHFAKQNKTHNDYIDKYCPIIIDNVFDVKIKPPLGAIPKYIHDGQRQEELKQAINRYFEANKPIPIEWVEEYNELAGDK